MYFPIIDVLKENFIAKIPSIVTQWLTDNVDPVGSAVVVDESLSISGAAADSKITGDEISDLKSDLSNIYNYAFTKSETDSGWFIYPCSFKKGNTYSIKNTSETGLVSFRTRYTEQGSTIDTYDAIGAGNTYTFVATGDANYIRVNFTKTNQSFEVNCKESINSIYGYVNSGFVTNEKVTNVLSATKDSSGRVAYLFPVKANHKYQLKNTSATAAITASTRDSTSSSTNIDVITDGLLAGRSTVFTATTDAPVLSVYSDGAGSFEFVDYETISAEIDKKGNTFKPFASGYIPFAVPVNQSILAFDDTGESTEDSESIVNVDCVLKLPDSYTTGGVPTKLLMLCHGASHGVTGDNNWTTNGSYNNLVNAFVSSGYAVFDCNGYNNTADGHDFWGCPRGIEAWIKAYQYIVNNYNVEHEFCIYAFSMGALTALNLAFHNFPNIKAIGLGSAVLKLDLCAVETSMRTAYGITGSSYDPTKTYGSNPYQHIKTIDDLQICDTSLPPIKIWFGSTETGTYASYVNKQYASEFVTAIHNSGGYAIYREVEGASHSMSYGNIQAINTEMVYWFNRFN